MARPGLRNHPKYKTLIFLLGVGEAQVIGHLTLLWMSSYENGDPFIGGQVQVEATAAWNGEPGKLTAALRDCGGAERKGFIELVPDSTEQYMIHDLFDHAPDYVRKRRAREDERKCKSKPRKGLAVTGKRRRNSVSDRKTAPLSALPLPLPLPLPVLGDESPKTPLAPSRQEPAAEQAVPTNEPAGKTAAEDDPQSRQDDPVLLVFPVVGGKRGQGPTEWPLRRSKLAEYAESYPGVNALAECKKALQWCRDNPTKRKTLRGMGAFLSRWLSKAQDSGGTNGAPASPQKTLEDLRREAAERHRRYAPAEDVPTLREVLEERDNAR